MDLDVKLYQQADFPDILKWQALAFMKTAWPSIFQGAIKFLDHTYPPECHPVHFAMHTGDSLIAYATVMQLPLTHAQTDFTLSCFGNLFTFPPYRGEGYGLQVLQAATTYLHQSDADLAGLFCDAPLIPFYERCGWTLTRSPTYVGTPLHKDLAHEDEAAVSRLMLFLSPRGQTARHTFDTEALYVPWFW